MLKGLNEDLTFPLLQRRPAIKPCPEPLDIIAGRRVMITGAGGSIGSELMQQIAAMQPAALILAELSELNLYEINCTLREANVSFEVLPLLVDVRDSFAIERVFENTQPSIVFHAAALKHVPLLENDHNLIEAVRTNVQGTYNIAQMCSWVGSQMVLVSTDKAVNPSSVMGLTKRVGELVATAQAYIDGDLLLSVVRFGNVLGSSGSFVPMFRRQIAQGGPVTVTHQHMRRFLMTIKEAVALVLEAAQARNGAIAPWLKAPSVSPWLFVLEMGRQVHILDIAKQLIEQAGLRVGTDIEIEFIGIRPGEKMEEELFYENEHLIRHVIPGVSGCRIESPEIVQLMPAIHEMCEAAKFRDAAKVKELLVELVPSYSGRDVWK